MVEKRRGWASPCKPAGCCACVCVCVCTCACVRMCDRSTHPSLLCVPSDFLYLKPNSPRRRAPFLHAARRPPACLDGPGAASIW